jgi:hypothetical protein
MRREGKIMIRMVREEDNIRNRKRKKRTKEKGKGRISRSRTGM